MFDAKDGISTGSHGGHCGGRLTVVGIGPGGREDRTHRAERAIRDATVIIGYRPYLESLADLTADKDVRPSGMRQEIARVDAAIDEAVAGQHVALISSGDAGYLRHGGCCARARNESRVVSRRRDRTGSDRGHGCGGQAWGAPHARLRDVVVE